MSGRVKRFMLRLDSGQRLVTPGNAAGDAVYALQRPLTVFSAQVVSVSLPNSMYQITARNRDVDTSLGSVVIADGTYTGAGLAAAVQGLLVALDATFTVAYSSTTGKYTIARVGAFTLLWGTGANAATSAFRQLGFVRADTASLASHTSLSVADLTAPAYVYVNSDALALGSGETVGPAPTATRPTKSKAIARVPLAGAFGGMTTWEQALWDEDLSYERAGSLISEVDLYLTDENGVVVDLNGREWAIDISLIASSQ